MSKKLDGICFKNMVEYAVRNLKNNVKIVNQLNVFPVPDGDTGTNMVTTIHNALKAVGESIIDLSSVSKKFARSVVFEARGNSGVIVSQFLKGMAEKFYDVDVADGALFIEALEKGVEYAYSSVAAPVEGTMLTVVKDATLAVKEEFVVGQDIQAIVDSFIRHAKRSLENTPELLSVLKDAGVVDSGGAGIVYLFEGMKKYLDGESLAALSDDSSASHVDYDTFDRNSVFPYGYCTEFLLQLLNGRKAYDPALFKEQISKLGDSLVISSEQHKIHVHIHTQSPESVLALCHQYGEFLSLKIENMTVQHTELSKRILCSDRSSSGAFSVITIASDPHIQKLFIDMGADVSILADDSVSTGDYLAAFEKCRCQRIFVFPNSSDGILTAMQAKKLYTQGNITVLNTRTIAECYAALPIIDFEETDFQPVMDSITEVLNNLLVLSIANKDHTFRYKDMDIHRNEYYSFSGKDLIAIGNSLEETALRSIQTILTKQGRDIITVFYSPETEDVVHSVIETAKEQGIFADFFQIPVQNLSCCMTISFE